MLKHIVMWQFKDEAEGKTKQENCEYIKAMLEALPAKISLIKKLEVGIHEGVPTMAADMSLYTEFESMADLNAYQVHPDHVKVSEYVAKVRTSRMVCDYTV